MRRPHGIILVLCLLWTGALSPVRLAQAAEITGTVTLSDGDTKDWLKRMAQWFHVQCPDDPNCEHATPDEQAQKLAEKFNGTIYIQWDASK